MFLFLATQGWQKLADENSQSVEPNDTSASYILAINHLIAKFQTPLEAAGTKIVDKFHNNCMRHSLFPYPAQPPSSMVELFHSPNASDWTNILKNIKLEKQSSMSNELLDDLLIVNIEEVNVDDFKVDDNIELWWKAKIQCPNQQWRRVQKQKFRRHSSTSDIDSESSSDTDILEDWDSLMDDYCDM